MNLTRIYTNGIIVIFHTIIALLIIELISYIVIKNFYKEKIIPEKIIYSNDFRYSPHPYLTYYPTPNYSNGETYHNSIGYRGDEIKDKKEDIYRIIIVGGSTTYTESVKENEYAFPYLMEKLLTKNYNVEVINAGIGGHSSFETLINIAFRVIDLDPDMVIVYHGTNDVHTRFVPPNLHLSDNTGRRKHWSFEDKSIASILELSATYRLFTDWENSIKTSPNHYTGASTNFYFTNDPMNILSQNSIKYIKRNYENIISILKARNIDIMLSSFASTTKHNHYGAWESYQAGFAQHNKMIADLGNSYNIPVLDFENLMPQDIQYWADGVHLNKNGSHEKAKIFSNFLIKNYKLEKFHK